MWLQVEPWAYWSHKLVLAEQSLNLPNQSVHLRNLGPPFWLFGGGRKGISYLAHTTDIEQILMSEYKYVRNGYGSWRQARCWHTDPSCWRSSLALGRTGALTVEVMNGHCHACKISSNSLQINKTFIQQIFRQAKRVKIVYSVPATNSKRQKLQVCY